MKKAVIMVLCVLLALYPTVGFAYDFKTTEEERIEALKRLTDAMQKKVDMLKEIEQKVPGKGYGVWALRLEYIMNIAKDKKSFIYSSNYDSNNSGVQSKGSEIRAWVPATSFSWTSPIYYSNEFFNPSVYFYGKDNYTYSDLSDEEKAQMVNAQISIIAHEVEHTLQRDAYKFFGNLLIPENYELNPEHRAYLIQYAILRLLGTSNTSKDYTDALSIISNNGKVTTEELDKKVNLNDIGKEIEKAGGLENLKKQIDKMYPDTSSTDTDLYSDEYKMLEDKSIFELKNIVPLNLNYLNNTNDIQSWLTDIIQKLEEMRENDQARLKNKEEHAKIVADIHGNNDTFMCDNCGNTVQHWWFEYDEYLGPHWQCPICEKVTKLYSIKRADGKTYQEYANERKNLYNDLIEKVKKMAEDRIREINYSNSSYVNHPAYAGYIDYMPRVGTLPINQKVTFFANPSDSDVYNGEIDGSNLSYVWYVNGEGISSGEGYNQNNPPLKFEYKFDKPGMYEVKLEVYDRFGVSSFNTCIVNVDNRNFDNKSIFKIGNKTYGVNGETNTMDVAPYIKNGRTYMPVRFVANSLGISNDNISWDNKLQQVTLKKGDNVIKMSIGSKSLDINGNIFNMDVAPELTNDRTMLPIRFVAEALGSIVDWNGAENEVTLKY